MSILAQSASFSPKTKTTVTVGTFDGVHLGHQKIIAKLVEAAKKNGSAPTLLTFDPHPRKVVQPNSSVDLIQTLEERAETLAHLGLKHMVVHPFTKAFSQLNAADYVKTFLVDMLNIDQIIIGYNHRFGKNRTASVEDLKHFGEIYDLENDPGEFNDLWENGINDSLKLRLMHSHIDAVMNTSSAGIQRKGRF